MDNADVLAQLHAINARVDAWSSDCSTCPRKTGRYGSSRSSWPTSDRNCSPKRAGTFARRSDDRAAEIAGAAYVSSEPVNIRILDREYTIGVDPDGRESLMAAAKLLDGKMREVRGANRMAAVDRIAVLAALNLAHELQQLRDSGSGQDREIARTLTELQRKLDSAIDAAASSGA
jgi:cell division protein ZapA